MLIVVIGHLLKLRAGSPEGDPAIQTLVICPAGDFSLLSVLVKLEKKYKSGALMRWEPEHRKNSMA